MQIMQHYRIEYVEKCARNLLVFMRFTSMESEMMEPAPVRAKLTGEGRLSQHCQAPRLFLWFYQSFNTFNTHLDLKMHALHGKSLENREKWEAIEKVAE